MDKLQDPSGQAPTDSIQAAVITSRMANSHSRPMSTSER